ncbi:MAG TPA: tyrosine-type recombinase/integrase [Devosiaceae bacterium]
MGGAVLTDVRARRIGPGAKPVYDGTVPGLQLVPSSVRGTGKWILRYVSPVTGKRRDMGLGRYPEVGLSAARKAAFEAREVISGGSDPLELRRAEREALRVENEVPTFEEAARQVFEDIRHGFRNPKHADQWINTLERYIFPKIGSRVVSELRASDFADALRPIWLDKPETASRVRQRCDTVMKWCAARDYVVASPVGVVGKLLARQPGKRERVEHHPALPWRDIPAFVRDVLHTENPSIGKQALEFLILTAARSGEVRGMTWAEIDFDKAIWTVPTSRMKARAAHRVPLSPRALEILAARKAVRTESPLVFPSRRNTPLSDMTLSKILRDANVPSDIPGRRATAHGFRSSFRDWASESGYPRDLAERALAHTIRNAAEAAYHRTDLLDARREMMQAWAVFTSNASPTSV